MAGVLSLSIDLNTRCFVHSLWRDKWVYAFVIIEDSRESDGVRDAEGRVYSPTDGYTNSTKDTKVSKLYCDSSTNLADLDSIAP